MLTRKMSRFQIIKRMYCTPIGNYSFARNIISKKIVETMQSETNQKKYKITDTNITELYNKKGSYSGNSYKGLWGCGVVKNGLDK